MRRAGVLLALASAFGVASVAHAAPPEWAPAAKATIHPGVVLETDGGQCTSNFVYYGGGEIYIGFAAHCAQEAGEGPINFQGEACRFNTLPVGSPVRIEGASQNGRLAYSSWRTMTQRGEKDANACNGNDFALVQIDPADHDRVNPSLPVYGGPTGLRRSSVRTGEKLLSFGRSGLRFDVGPLKPREGYLTSEGSNGWTHVGLFVTPGIFGDSGSAVLDGAGSATGVLVTLNFVPPGANGAADLAHALDYMERHGGPQVTLALGTESFRGPQFGPGLAPAPDPEPDPEPAPPPPAPAPPPQPPQPPQQQPPPPPPPDTAPQHEQPERAAPKRRTKPAPKKTCRKARGKRSRKGCGKSRRRR